MTGKERAFSRMAEKRKLPFFGRLVVDHFDYFKNYLIVLGFLLKLKQGRGELVFAKACFPQFWFKTLKVQTDPAFFLSFASKT